MTLTQLGNKSGIPESPDKAVIETFNMPIAEISSAVIRFTCPEFTSLCPITGQPDFATIIIDYVPNVRMIESKSLKLYLHSFRNHGAFHETVISTIGDRLDKEMGAPLWIRVVGYFYPRGGIPIDVVWERGHLGEHKPLPLDFPMYRGR